jgi:hypothetical protein
MMDNGNVAGEQIGKLRQKQCRAQIGEQRFGERVRRGFAVTGCLQYQRIGLRIALAAANRSSRTPTAASSSRGPVSVATLSSLA